jgi:conjugative element/phage-associated large polyvalent protein
VSDCPQNETKENTMNDQFPPIDWSIPPGTWPAWLPGSVFAGLPASWRASTPGDAWNQRASADRSSERPTGRGILGHLGSELVQTPPMPAQSTGGWYRNSPSWVQSAMPLGANVGFSAAPAEPAYQPWADPISDKLGRSAWERPPSVPNWEKPAPPPVVPRHGPDGWSYPGAQLDPTPPPPPRAFHTWLNGTLSNQNVRYYAGPGFYEALEKLAALAQFMPGSGTVQAGEDASQAREQAKAGNYGKAATHMATGTANALLDWMPGAKFVTALLGGIGAKTFPHAMRPIAEAMERAGHSVEEIWRATGLGRAVDGQWIFEIPDKGYRVNPRAGILDNEGNRTAPLFQQQLHPGLQEGYPGASKMLSSIRIDPRAPDGGAFTPGPPGLVSFDVLTAHVLKALGIHELQHLINYLERLPRGGNPLEFWRPGVPPKEARALYERQAGEVMARNATRRMTRSPEQLRLRSPLWTEIKAKEIPRDQQIIRYYPDE